MKFDEKKLVTSVVGNRLGSWDLALTVKRLSLLVVLLLLSAARKDAVTLMGRMQVHP